MKFLNNIDLTNNQALNMRVQNLGGFSTGLGSSHKGLCQFDTTSGQNVFGVFNGTAWVRLRDDYITSVTPAGSSPISISGTQALTVDISLATGSFLIGNPSNVARAVAKSAIPLSGFGAAAAAVDFGSNRITNLADPSGAQDAATKAYVDSSTQGLFVKTASRAATTGALPGHTFSNGVLTATANGALPSIDGVNLSVGNRVLVKDEGSGTSLQNGIYDVTSLGGVSTPWVLTRSADADTSAEVETGCYTLVTEGTVWQSTGWILTTPNPITLNTTPLTFTQFTAAGQLSAGNGLAKVGSVMHFATSSAYTPNAIPLATGTASIGFISNNATATSKYLRQISSGTPAWTQIDVSELTGSPVSGSGTTNILPKFTGSTTVGNSQIFDDGTKIGVNTASPTYHFDLQRSNDGIVYNRVGNSSAGNSARVGFAVTGESGLGGLFMEKFSSTFTAAASLQDCAMIYSTNSTHLCFGTVGTERMRIHTSGNVVIGSGAALDRARLLVCNGEIWCDYTLTGGSTNGAAARIATNSTQTLWTSNNYYNSGTSTIKRTRAGGCSCVLMDTSATSNGGTIYMQVAGNAAADADVSFSSAMTIRPNAFIGFGTGTPWVDYTFAGGLAVGALASSSALYATPRLTRNATDNSSGDVWYKFATSPTTADASSGTALHIQLIGGEYIGDVKSIQDIMIATRTTFVGKVIRSAFGGAGLSRVSVQVFRESDSTYSFYLRLFGGRFAGGQVVVREGGWGAGVTFLPIVNGSPTATSTPTGTSVFDSSDSTFHTGMSQDVVNARIGFNTSTPAAQMHIVGLGQTVSALTDAGAVGGTLLIQDTSGSVGAGGAIVLGATTSGALKTFAAIKALFSDGSGNGVGHLAFSTRAATSDTALTQRMLIDATTGAITIGNLSGSGSRLVFTSSVGLLSARTLVESDLPSHDASKISGGNLPSGVTIGSKAIARVVTMSISIGTTTIDLSHGLSTSDVHLMLRNGSGEYMTTDYTALNANTVRVTFAQATSEALTAVILG